MWSPNKRKRTPEESAHIERIKLMHCIVCNEPPPCDAHEPRQGLWWVAIPLCRECHQNLFGPSWRVRKWTDEWHALNELNRMLLSGT